MKPIDLLLLDLDGVIVNFNIGAIRAHLREGPLKLPHGTFYDPMEDCHIIASNERWTPGQSLMKYLNIETLDHFWRPINSDPLFWRGLPPYPWWQRMVQLCEGYCNHLAICTSPSNHHHSWGGKALWLKLNNLDHIPTIMMSFASNGSPKGDVVGKWLLAGPGRVLIDDHTNTIESFTKAGGHGILFPQPWNRNHHLSHDPLGYVADQLSQLTES